ncbi:hypothetical protein PUN28_007614 [Cardiocondyla obscurior]|uniref:Uncharacterized protein n=1 Tax=Cardiocondyla obscurior TaxID=286306 RepID=A0AAW2GA31_9HYME
MALEADNIIRNHINYHNARSLETQRSESICLAIDSIISNVQAYFNDRNPSGIFRHVATLIRNVAFNCSAKKKKKKNSSNRAAWLRSKQLRAGNKTKK